jgi:DNA-binding NarL/FixJ family response regulator
MKNFRILVVDDHELLHWGVAAALAGERGLEVCGQGANGEEAVWQMATRRPDVVLMDVAMPVMDGLEATRRNRRECLRARVVMLSGLESDHVIREFLRAGACAYVLKSEGCGALLEAVRGAGRVEPVVTPRVAQVLIRNAHGDGTPAGSITSRESTILELIAAEKDSHEIGALLGISHKTCDVHRANIMRKLEVQSVAELVLEAIRNKLIDA